MQAEWVHCPECGHRLFLLKSKDIHIEIKCPSCKKVIELTKENWEEKKDEHGR